MNDLSKLKFKNEIKSVEKKSVYRWSFIEILYYSTIMFTLTAERKQQNWYIIWILVREKKILFSIFHTNPKIHRLLRVLFICCHYYIVISTKSGLIEMKIHLYIYQNERDEQTKKHLYNSLCMYISFKFNSNQILWSSSTRINNVI